MFVISKNNFVISTSTEGSPVFLRWKSLYQGRISFAQWSYCVLP